VIAGAATLSQVASAARAGGDATHAIRKGSARLLFTHAHGRTRLERCAARSPLRILSPRNAGRGAWAFTSTFGGGLLAGDEIDLELDVGVGATAYISTQSATKVFRSKDSLTTKQRLQAQVGDGGMLVLLPDPTACFGGARYRQEQRIDLVGGGGGTSGSVVVLDWLTSGRHAAGERWAADFCHCRTEIWTHGACVLRDAIHLPPMRGGIGSGFFNCFATLILQGPRVAAHAQVILDVVREMPGREDNPLIAATPMAASRVGDGLLLRAAGANAEIVGRRILPFLDFLAAELGEAPWKRKW
jgi:urease accessory protein